jgi:hypothetical protein
MSRPAVDRPRTTTGCVGFSFGASIEGEGETDAVGHAEFAVGAA